MPVLEALDRLILQLDETDATEGVHEARGIMRFGAALRGPPGRVHGGYHVYARTLSILERLRAHEGRATYPCELELGLQRSLPLEEPVAFDATYRGARGDAGWELRSRFLGTDRLLATARSISDTPLLDDDARARWRRLHAESRAVAGRFTSFGITMHDAPNALWMEAKEPRRTAPESQHATLVDAAGVFGPAFACTQLDFVGAVAAGRAAEHPHFTKHIRIRLGIERIPADTHLVCIADRTTIAPDPESETPPVDVEGVTLGTVRVEVALFDADFARTYATGTITVHPVDASKFPHIGGTETLRTRR